MPMRNMMLLSLILLAGCSTMRQAAGAYANAVDKGISVRTTASEEPPKAAPATPTEAKAPPLPGGLVGDGQTHVYTEPSPRSS